MIWSGHALLCRLKPALFFADAFAVETKFPGAVQVHPIDAVDESALAIGSRIFRAGQEIFVSACAVIQSKEGRRQRENRAIYCQFALSH